MKPALLFDLDGTLLDTLSDLRDSTNFALKKFGFEGKNTETIRNSVGNGLKKLIQRSLPNGASEDTVDAVLAEMKAYYTLHCCDKTKPYEGILPMLHSLKSNGYSMAIVSNKADSVVQLLRNTYFEDLIPVAIGESDALKRKPAPDMIFAAMRKLHAEHAIYVGDSEVDIQTAKNAGLPCCSVCWGFRSKEQLSAAGAEQIASVPQELYEQIVIKTGEAELGG